ncbi:restriction endonuclease subunit S [Escherichia coli]|uniref:restriction endonuclease subunit S n=1 Tax=Escherichia coli TaxID=562 RepID=UPI000F93C84E|nr:restriction endonuclease subunit S [Escherichia coli]EFN5268395.1 restriction endonuclease subunit S [Escherichia coli]EHY5971599.1 restriction endonuclease subunit S [Escherichia coli]EHZ8225959.1 restriction endonuclease subunit S [Escherichia coli]EIA8236320.1 restriction endonuclease subunit S [Escherichia coli]EIM2908923.1 restriction endonuclease subunit S [Escherichia coli]
MVPKGWEQKKLEELCSLDAPITYGVLKPGEYFCGGIPLLQIKDLCDGSVLSNGLHLIPPELDYEYRRSRIIKNDILISLVGTIGRVAKYQSSSEANIHRNIGRIRSNQHEYLFHYLRSDDVQRGITDSASGSSQSALNLSTLRSMLILVPPVIEQKKIAKILSTWDKAISVTEKLLTNSQQQKKALMQQLLTGKKRLLDENGTRFSETWKLYTLSKLFQRVTTKNNGKSNNVVTISGQHGLIKQEDFFKKTVASDTLDGYFLLKKGQFAYNKSYSNGYPMGAIKRLNRYSEGVVTTLYICFELTTPKISCGDYWEHYFESGLLNNSLSQIAHEGGRAHGLLNVKPSDFFSLKVAVPGFEEQQKIASVLSAADTEISTLEKKLACLKDEKKALMQQLLTGKRRVKVDEAVAV